MKWLINSSTRKLKTSNSGNIVAIGVAIFTCVLMFMQFFYLGIYIKNITLDQSKNIAQHIAKEAANSVEVYFRDALTVTMTYADNFKVYRKNKIPRGTIYNLMKGSLTLNKNFIAIWTMFEPNAYDNNDQHFANDQIHDKNGSFALAFYYHDTEIKQEINQPEDYSEDYYTIPKSLLRPVILDPFHYQYHGNDKIYFETSLVSPVMVDDTFLGVVGIDIDMFELQSKFNAMKVQEGATLSLISNSGIIVTHHNAQFIEKNINDFVGNEKYTAIDSIKKGKEFIVESQSWINKEPVLRYYYPINIQYMAKPWYVMIEIPYKNITDKSKHYNTISFIFLLSFLLLIAYLVYNIIDRRKKEKKLIENIHQLEIAKVELAKHRDNLEELVWERTREIQQLIEELSSSNDGLMMANEHLQQQKEELSDTLNKLKIAQEQVILSEKMASLGIMAAGIAHEINNPLNFIQGGIFGIESYTNTHLNEHLINIKPLIDAIKEGVSRASVIVKSLNHYSRNSNLEFAPVHIHPVIENCLVILHHKIKNRIVIETAFTFNNDLVYGNESKLHQVLLNILDNAIQAIDNEGKIEITTVSGNTSFTITITDNGKGINKDDLPKIFDPFFTTKEQGKGVGLGLSISHNIIQEHKGTLEFDSEPGKGTKVIITLPLIKTEK